MTKSPPLQIQWMTGAPPPEVDEAALRTALRTFLDRLGHAAGSISLLVGDDGTLAELNAAHRGMARTTDILSWSYLTPDDPAPAVLGDLAVSWPRVTAQAAEHGWDAQTELLRLLAHGCAHLIGMDHQTPAADRAMRTVEEDLLAAVGLRGLYPG